MIQKYVNCCDTQFLLYPSAILKCQICKRLTIPNTLSVIFCMQCLFRNGFLRQNTKKITAHAWLSVCVLIKGVLPRDFVPCAREGVLCNRELQLAYDCTSWIKKLVCLIVYGILLIRCLLQKQTKNKQLLSQDT